MKVYKADNSQYYIAEYQGQICLGYSYIEAISRLLNKIK